MNQKTAIIFSGILGAVVLVLVLAVGRPFSKFEDQYPMTVASGSAVSGEATEASSGSAIGVAASGAAASVPVSGPATIAGTYIEYYETSATGIDLVNAAGKTLQERVITPEGFTRTEEDEGSLGEFLRNYKLKKDGSPVLLYNKEEKSNQSAHIAVFKLPLEDEDLQQCADSVMRVYAEYFKKIESYGRIQFSLSDNFKASYIRWREGFRIHENGDSYSWSDDAEYDSSDENFKKFMRIVFAYSGTYQLENDSQLVSKDDLKIGDIFITSGNPGHVVMVVDTCTDGSGRKAFLLAQGYMPAQQFQLLKNPAHADDPWYYVDELSYPFQTPEYTFDTECLRRPLY